MVRAFELKQQLVALGLMLLLCIPGCSCLGSNCQVRKKERILKQELYAMRVSIDGYTVDKNAAPQHLEDLVRAGYLRSIPKDPFTDSGETWKIDHADVLRSLDQTRSGITDIHSGSDLVGTDGRPYSTW